MLVDPYWDPELALALRVAMEEERARQEAAAKRATEEAARQETGAEQSSTSQDATMLDNVNVEFPNVGEKGTEQMDTGSALLEQALAISMDDPWSRQSGGMEDADMSNATIEDEDLALALKMSIQDSGTDPASQTEMSQGLGDQSFMSSILTSLPSVDPNDPSVRDLLASLQAQG